MRWMFISVLPQCQIESFRIRSKALSRFSPEQTPGVRSEEVEGLIFGFLVL